MTTDNPNQTDPVLRVLHIDDDPFEQDRVRLALEANAMPVTFRIESFGHAEPFRARLKKSQAPDVVILDIDMGEGHPTGIDLARETRRAYVDAVILICSNADDIASIGECLSAGADDFISKRSDKGELSLRVFHSYQLAVLKQGRGGSVQKSPQSTTSRQVAGKTLEKIARRVPLIVGSAVTAVAIQGESGTGKEVVADLFQQILPKGTPFIKVNCGAISPTLLESELFGHAKGAFTGALSDKRGLLEAASGGWIFLDEVATLSLSAQVALLRVLENRELTRVGSTRTIPIDVKVISATNDPLNEQVKKGKFRKDLWQRLRETEIHLPPLRERPDEIVALVAHFCKTMPGGPYTVSGPVLEVLTKSPWRQGNVRELRNCLRAMTELHVSKLLTPLSIPEWVWDQLGEKSDGDSPRGNHSNDESAAFDRPTQLILQINPSLQLSYDDLADQLLLELVRKLSATFGKLSLRRLAKAINMSRSTLAGRLKTLVHKNLIALSELSNLVGVGDKSSDET